MKTVELSQAQAHLLELFNEARSGFPVLLVRGDEVVKLERIDPPEFGGDRKTLESMLLDSVRGPHGDWTHQDLEDIASRVRARRER